jgi:hypothetical protein
MDGAFSSADYDEYTVNRFARLIDQGLMYADTTRSIEYPRKMVQLIDTSKPYFGGTLLVLNHLSRFLDCLNEDKKRSARWSRGCRSNFHPENPPQGNLWL